ncbi:GGDEF domain-containing response regulator [Agaribacterium haliotis]|uniref:GGDEF domain-containing response regulator n=1 Tax=Agaribacterium haliotis TaxID=2013869 RepID=UPI000BB59D29|nr:diguanylate cyclase [Agaribacterium haliotis]
MSALSNEQHYNILIVEDDPVNIDIIVDALSGRFRLFVAKSRAKAMRVLEQQDMHLVLLDVGLPDGNGFEICHTLVENERDFGPLAIVFMTGMDQPDDEAKGIELGARDYITKPINITVLRARLNLQTQLIRQTELLSQLARIDGLTEVHNRRAFDDQLRIEWNRCMREDQSLSLCLLDVDFFKQYNDIYGHPAGDEALKAVARSLKNTFKRSSDFIARYGGEEFAILIYNSDQVIAERLMNNALDAVQQLCIEHSGSQVSDYLSFSAGLCSTVPDELVKPDDLIRCADTALYEAKGRGRARIVYGDLE